MMLSMVVRQMPLHLLNTQTSILMLTVAVLKRPWIGNMDVLLIFLTRFLFFFLFYHSFLHLYAL